MQEILAALVVFSAVAYLGQRTYKSLFSKKSSCEVNCGCEPSSNSPALEEFKKRG